MLRYLILAIIFFSLAMVVYLFMLGRISRSQAAFQDGTQILAACPPTSNCLCSEYAQDKPHYIDPVDLWDKPPLTDLNLISFIIIDMGGEIRVHQQGYLSATFKSGFFGFVDDFDLRHDLNNKKLHLRSASRVGRSDFGKNRQRIENFKKEFELRH